MAPSSQADGIIVPVANGYASSLAAKANLPSHFIGGNNLDVAPVGVVKDFVAKNDGHSVITSVSCLCLGCGQDRKDEMLISVPSRC